MYFNRKIDSFLIEWKNKNDRFPLLVYGIRQCGKTESIRHFAESYFENFIEINFWTNPEFISDFNNSLDVNNLISNISLHFPNIDINPSNTLIFLDEIQDCPRAHLAFKNFVNDGRYFVIGSGSYLGITGYNIGDVTPIPTGYEEIYHMNTMDFEEFMWANGINEDQINILESYFIEKKIIPNNLNDFYNSLFTKYICIGGFPKAVSSYLLSNNMLDGIKVVQNNILNMKSDFGRRVDKNKQPLFKPHEVARIQNVFDLIPTFLSKENKRFITSKITSGRSNEKTDAIEYLNQAHIVYKVFNLENVSLPLLGNKIQSQFKLFPTDIGIVSSMYGIDTIIAINKGNLGQAKGAIYEAVVFDNLYKAGIDTFYFAKESGLEIDFVICYNGYSYLIEAKAKSGNTKSSKTVLNNPNHYGECKLLKIGNYNISENGSIITIPHYLTYVLGKYKEQV